MQRVCTIDGDRKIKDIRNLDFEVWYAKETWFPVSINSKVNDLYVEEDQKIMIGLEEHNLRLVKKVERLEEKVAKCKQW